MNTIGVLANNCWVGSATSCSYVQGTCHSPWQCTPVCPLLMLFACFWFLQRRKEVIFLYQEVHPGAKWFLDWTSYFLWRQVLLIIMGYLYLCQKWICPLSRNDNPTLYFIYYVPLDFTWHVLLLERVLTTLPEHPRLVQHYMGFVLLLFSFLCSLVHHLFFFRSLHCLSIYDWRLLIPSLFGVFIFSHCDYFLFLYSLF